MTVLDGDGLVIVHDQVGELGGSERVLQAILDRYPAAGFLAPEFTTTNAPRGQLPWDGRLRSLGTNGPRRHFLAPLYSRRVARRPLERAALVLSLAHSGWSMAVRVPPGARHVCYNAGPPRWLYGHTSRYLGSYSAPLRPLLRAAVPALRRHHKRQMRRPDRVLANSAWSAGEIARLFGRRSQVLYPPVRTDFFTPAPASRRHVLAVARLVPHKRIDVVVEAFRRLEHELVVVGGGPCLQALRASAPPNVRFTGYVEDAQLRDLYRSSMALVCPSVEEFGIVMAEAHAAGTPVIAPKAGGACEIVDDRVTGLLLDRLDASSLAMAVEAAVRHRFNPSACRASAERFAERHFTAALDRVLAEELALARDTRQPTTRFRTAPQAA
jgi:glycosyltransferase involved in cell wall biosynthesis